MNDPSPLVLSRPALGSVELASIARGIVALDQMAKRAETTLVAHRTLSPGRYWILICGNVAEVEEALDAARKTAEEDLVDSLFLPDPAPGLRAALSGDETLPIEESLAIVETTTVSSALLAADRALKEADVRLLELRLGAGLTGKGVFTLTGPLHMVEAARDIARRAIESARLIRVELIAQPHPDLQGRLLDAEPARPRGVHLER